MPTDPRAIDPRPWGAALAGVVAALGAVGWLLQMPTLISLRPHWAYMHWSTAGGLLICAAALALRASSKWQWLARILGGLVAIFGCLRLITFALGIDLPLPEPFELPANARAVAGARMAPNTAVCFSFFGVAMAFDDARFRSPRVAAVVGIAVSVTAALGMVGTASYLTGLGGLASWHQLMGDMALHTALGFSFLGAAKFAFLRVADPHYELWAPRAISLGGMGVALTLWQMIDAAEARMMAEVSAGTAPDGARTLAADIVLVVGIGAALLAGRLVERHLAVDRRSRALAEANRKLQARRDELTAINEVLEDRTTELEHLARELDGFSGAISHDLRAPLRAISGFAEILEEDHADAFDADATRVLGVIQKNAEKMRRQIEALLSFSRLARQPLRTQDVDMDALVEATLADVLAAHAGEFPDAPAPRVDRGPLGTVPADPALLSHVWVNLLSNAVKYSHKVSHPRVEVRRDDDGDLARFTVSDNGAGFDPEYADKLFVPFQRLHGPEEFAGTGVGLSTVQRIIRRHGGKVAATSAPGQGARFTFSVPKAAHLERTE